MHPVDLTEGEVVLFKQARKEHNWKILPTWKLRYLYQRMVAFPAGDMKAVKEIAELAKKERVEKIQRDFDGVFGY